MMLIEQRDAVAQYSQRIAAAGLVVASAGNVSVRAENLVVMTPRRMWLESVDAASCIVLDLKGDVIEGHGRPSSETPLHLAIYRASEFTAVVHTHPRYATALSTVVDELPAIHYSIAAFGGPTR